MARHPRRWRALRAAAWAAGGIVALAAMALIAGFVAAHTDWGRDRVRRKLERELGALVDGRVTIGRVEGGLLGRPVLRHIVVVDRAGVEALRLDGVSIDYELLPLLLRGDVHLRDVVIAELTIAGDPARLRRAAQPGPRQRNTTRVAIDRLRIVAGEATLWGTAFAQLSADGTLAWHDGVLEMTVASIRGTWRARGRALAVALAGQVQERDGDLVAHDVRATIGDSALSLNRVHVTADGTIDPIDLDGMVAGADLTPLLPAFDWRPDLVMAGTVSRAGRDAPFAARLVGEIPGLTVTLAGRLGTGEWAEMFEEAHFDGTARATGLDPHALAVRLPHGDVSGALTFSLTGIDPATLRAHTRGTAGGLIDGHLVSRAAIDATLDAGLVRGELAAIGPEGSGHASGAAQLRGVRALDQVHVVARGLDLGALWPALGVASSPLAVDAIAHGPLASFALDGTANALAVRAGELTAPRVAVGFHLRALPDAPAGTAVLEAAGVHVGARRVGHVWAQAASDDQGRRIALTLRAGGARDPYGADGDFHIARDPGNPGAPTRVTVGRLVVRTRALRWSANAGVIATFGAGRDLNVDRLTLRSNGGLVSLAGSMSRSARDLDVAVRVTALDLPAVRTALALPALPPSGTISLRAQVDRRRGRTRLTAVGDVADLAWRADMPAVDGTFTIDDAPGALTAHAVLTGRGFGAADLRVDVRAPVDALSPAAWRRLAPQAVRSARLSLHGVRLEEALRLAGVRAGRRFDGLTGAAELMLADGRLTIDGNVQGGRRGALAVDATVAPPRRLLDLTGWRTLDERALLAGELTVRSAQVDWWRDLVPRASPLGRVVAELVGGRVDVIVAMAEHGASARVEVVLRDARTRHVVEPFGASFGAMVSADHVDATLATTLGKTALATGQLRLGDGLTALRRDGAGALLGAAATGTFEIPQLSLAMIARALGRAPHTPLAGAFAGTGTIGGTLAAPRLAMGGDVTAAAYESVAFERLRLDATLAAGRLGVRVEAAQRGGGTLATRGAIDLATLGRLDVTAVARDFDLHFLAGLARGESDLIARAEGIVNADVHVVGSWAAPTPSGWARVRGGSVRVRRSLPPLEDLMLAAHFDRSHVALVFSTRSGEGQVEVSLDVALASASIVGGKGRIKTHRFPVASGHTVVAVDVDAGLTLTRKPGVLTLAAAVRTATLALPRHARRTLHELPAFEDIHFVDAAAPRTRSTAWRLPVLRLLVTTPGPVIARADDFDAQLEAELEVTYAAGRTTMTGHVEATSGHVVYRDHRYDVLAARAVFGIGGPGDPRLDVRLAHDFGKVTVFVLVTGTFRDRHYALRSEPGGYDEAELLALVLGRDPSDPSAGSDTARSLDDRALGFVSGLLLGQIQELLGNALPIDVLRIDTDDGPAGATERLTVGKWVTRNLFFSYRRRAAAAPGENTHEVNAEYRLGRRWILELLGGDQNGGADMLWIRRW